MFFELVRPAVGVAGEGLAAVVANVRSQSRVT